MKRICIIIAMTTAAIMLAIILSGCQNTTRISSILNNPDRYQDRTVSIAGEVTKTYAVDLVIAEAGAYQVDDGTGKIWVITRNGVPRDGSKVGVKGRIESGIKLAGESLLVVLREEKRRTQ